MTDQRTLHLLAEFNRPADNEADLVVPTSRKYPFESVGSAPPETEPEEVPGPIDVDETIRRFTSVCKYYQGKYPAENKSALRLHVEKIYSDSKKDPEAKMNALMVLVNGYDEKLVDSDRLIHSLETRLNSNVDKLRQYVLENERLRKHDDLIEELGKRVEILMAENKLLLDEKEKSDPIVERAFELEQELERVKFELSLKDREELTKVRAENSALIAQQRVQYDDLQMALSDRRQLTEQLKLREYDLSTLRNEKSDLDDRYQRLCKWHSQAKAKLDEYDDCCQELGISDWLPEFDKHHGVPGAENQDGILMRALVKVKREYLQCKKKLKETTDDLSELTKAHAGLVQRYQLDLDKAETNSKLLKDSMDQFERSISQAKHERDVAIHQAKEQGRECAGLRMKLKDFMKDAEAEHENLYKKTREQVAGLQDQWAQERQKYLHEINVHKKSKVDLQCEVGFLLRDKRSSELELNNAMRNLNIQRDKFKKELFGM